MSLRFWNQTLQNISQDQRKDKFVFIINNEIFEVPLSYALGISPLITDQYLKDPTFREFQISDKAKIEEEFLNFIEGKKISKEIFIKIGQFLKNKEMIAIWKRSFKSPKERATEYIKCIHEIDHNSNGQSQTIKMKDFIDNDYLKEVLQYLGNHIEEMKEEIQKLRIDDLINLIRNNILIESENTLWDIFKGPIKKMRNMSNNQKLQKKEKDSYREKRRILLESIQITNLNKKSFKEYIEELETEDILNDLNHDTKRCCVWKQLQTIIMNNIDGFKISNNSNNFQIENRKSTVIEYQGYNSKGIIQYLEKKYGPNHNIFSISASSTCSEESPDTVIKYESSTFWYSNDNIGEWWEINFKNTRVRLTGYSLKIYHYSIGDYLKNWVVEGRNEGEDWKEVDRQDNNDLNHSSSQHYYPIQISEPYQFIRIKIIGKNHNNNYILNLCGFEIFGELFNEDEIEYEKEDEDKYKYKNGNEDEDKYKNENEDEDDNFYGNFYGNFYENEY